MSSPSRREAAFVVAIAVVTTAGLTIERVVDVRAQAWLGLGCTALFVAVACRVDVHERRQALGVVAVATFFEVVGAQLWGLYDYRLGNLPLFVPAGHGLVFLTGLRLSQVPLLVRYRSGFVRVTAVVASVWAVLGASGLLGTHDLSGVFGSALVVVMLVRGRQAGLFAGVWWFVAYLELYGTAVGTWTWSPVVPGLGLPAGNPPSGVASGYVVFDWLAGVLVAGATRFAQAVAATTG
ncbi:hypothetical protein ACIA03_10870 [Nocardioides sp. NPDC051685]|uniref:hypothetical protein n=1 Tax=Nocardioides sp. NPDC051685 TaxID=3364334 RepID=UPI00378DBC98